MASESVEMARRRIDACIDACKVAVAARIIIAWNIKRCGDTTHVPCQREAAALFAKTAAPASPAIDGRGLGRRRIT